MTDKRFSRFSPKKMEKKKTHRRLVYSSTAVQSDSELLRTSYYICRRKKKYQYPTRACIHTNAILVAGATTTAESFSVSYNTSVHHDNKLTRMRNLSGEAAHPCVHIHTHAVDTHIDTAVVPLQHIDDIQTQNRLCGACTYHAYTYHTLQYNTRTHIIFEVIVQCFTHTSRKLHCVVLPHTYIHTSYIKLSRHEREENIQRKQKKR